MLYCHTGVAVQNKKLDEFTSLSFTVINKDCSINVKKLLLLMISDKSEFWNQTGQTLNLTMKAD